MTRKGDRTGSLRRLPKAETFRDEGTWVDESFPVAAVDAAIQGVCPAEIIPQFHRFLGVRIGMYRARQENREGMPSVSQEQALVDELMEYLIEVQKRLEHLPPVIRANASQVTWERFRKSYGEFLRPHIAGLKQLADMLTLAERALDPIRNQKGAKGKPHRDWLLFEVADWLKRAGLRKTAAAGTAAAVLQAVGIEVPEDPKEAAAIVGRVSRELCRGEE